jgi:hypothetical protein
VPRIIADGRCGSRGMQNDGEAGLCCSGFFPRPPSRFARAVVVVVPAPGVEAGLGGFKVRKAAALGLQRAVQPFELAHGLGWRTCSAGGPTPKGSDAEADQPDRAPGEPGRAVLLPPPSFRIGGLPLSVIIASGRPYLSKTRVNRSRTKA